MPQTKSRPATGICQARTPMQAPYLKLPQYACLPHCAAPAGLSRLGQSGLVTRVLGFDEMLPAACQVGTLTDC
jgi:hypothetical protein